MSTFDVRTMYQVTTKTGQGIGIEGYHVDKKYLDANKMKQEKVYASRQKSVSSKPINVSQKRTFIDELQKHSGHFPGPCTYEPYQIATKSKTQSIVHPGNRKTIFDQIDQMSKKYNFPSSVKYSKVQSEVDKSKLKGNMNKADNSTYLQSQMRTAIDGPGVGNYNSYRGEFADKSKGNKWIQGKNKRNSQLKTKQPPVGTYDPVPVDISLFSSVSNPKQKSKSIFNKSQRFKSQKQKDLPFYDVLSEWGMKGKLTKKDILSKITRNAGHHSVYY